MKVAIPRFRERVAPCFEYSATIAIFTIEDGRVVGQTDFTLRSSVELDRVRLLRDQEVDILICGGVQESFEDLVRAHGIEVISWVTGEVEDLLRRFIRGKLDGEFGARKSCAKRAGERCRGERSSMWRRLGRTERKRMIELGTLSTSVSPEGPAKRLEREPAVGLSGMREQEHASDAV